MKLTGETITDEQIDCLLAELEADLAAAQTATGYFASGSPIRESRRIAAARARCAALLNARNEGKS